MYPLGKEYLKLGDEAATRRVFRKLEGRIEADLQRFGVRFHGVDFYEDTLYELGNIYMELGGNAFARRVFVQLLKHFPDSDKWRILHMPKNKSDYRVLNPRLCAGSG